MEAAEDGPLRPTTLQDLWASTGQCLPDKEEWGKEQWRLTEESSPLLEHLSPELNLQALVISPGFTEHLAKEHWQRGIPRGLSLLGKRKDLH